MSEEKKKTRRKGAGKPVSRRRQEKMLQLYAIEGTYSAVARRMGISPHTVKKYVDQMLQEKDPKVMRARQERLAQLASKVHNKAEEIIEAIAPEDLESGREFVRDEDGNIVRVVQYGPSLMQKVTAAAILTDKIKVLRETEGLMEQGVNDGSVLMPSDIGSLVSGIKSKLKSISVLNVRFEEDHPDLSQRIQEKLEEAEIEAEIEDAELEPLSLEAFDGND